MINPDDLNSMTHCSLLDYRHRICREDDIDVLEPPLIMTNETKSLFRSTVKFLTD